MSELAELLQESMNSLCRVLIAWEEVGQRLKAGQRPAEAWSDYDRIILEHRTIERRIMEIGKARL